MSNCKQWYPFQDFRNFLHVTFNNRGSNDWNRPLWLNWRMPEVYIQWLYINLFIRTFFITFGGGGGPERHLIVLNAYLA